MNNRGGLLDATMPLDLSIEDSFLGALQFCSMKLSRDVDGVIELLCEEDSLTHSYFRYSLAKHIGEYLGSLSGNFRGIYVHGSAVKSTSGPGSDIDLIVLIENRRKELGPLLAKLNAELEFQYSQLMGGEYFSGGYADFMDIKLVDREDLEKSRGYGSVLGSLHSAPVKIWDTEN